LFAEVLQLRKAGTIDPLIAEVGDLADAPRMLHRLGDRSTTGKLVVSVARQDGTGT
jgi:NADPH:quinone reductase-like Zn-dependent oxidoreductase